MTFPPDNSNTGGYVLIDEPGRYTLEHNITHTYPVGVIITSSSVILDGQGFSITPATTGDPSVGVWISLTDKEGKPVTGVTIQNCSVSGEVTGVYAEGIDSSEFPWGTERHADPDMVQAANTPRDLKLSDLVVENCTTGISSKSVSRPVIRGSEIRYNQNGILVSGGSPEIRELTVSENTGDGIILSETTGGEVTGDLVEDNAGAGIFLDRVSGLVIWNNILDNPVNIRQTGSSSVRLQKERKNQSNIINGVVSGGNLWATGGVPVYSEEGIGDADGDGIGDIPYETGPGLSDLSPLVPSGSGFVPPEVITTQVTPENTPTPVPTPLSVITGIHAVINGDSIPVEMQSGQTYHVNITITNDGSDDWQVTQGIGIKAEDIAATAGPEWQPVNSVVPSKQSYTLNFDLTAPAEPGTYDLTYVAKREGQGVTVTFGRPYIKTVKVE
ncbi:MAG: right-handed parallel beta-helix repeat-containing protein [Methanospirillum sp.]|nr:right-handed parallel beta-helix repeat-containing protein [Methanospirillum sp.]